MTVRWARCAVLLIALLGGAVRGGAAYGQSDEIAALKQQIGELYQASKYREAVPLAERSLQLTRAQKGEDHLDTATSFSILAALYQYQGQYREAEPLFSQALHIREKLLPPNHPDIESALSDLGTLYDIQGRQKEAEPLHWRAIEIREAAQPPGHPDMVVTLFNVANLYKTPAQLAAIERLYQRALAIDENALGVEDPHVVTNIYNLADLYEVENRYPEAEKLYERVLRIYAAALSSTKGYSGDGLDGLVIRLERHYRAQRRAPEAQPLYVEAVATRGKSVEPVATRSQSMSVRSSQTSSEELASLYQSLGCYAEAEALIKDALRRKELSLPRETDLAKRKRDIAKQASNLINLYLAERDWVRAAHYLRQNVQEDSAIVTGIVNPDNETWRSKWQFFGLVKVAHRLAEEGSFGKSVPALPSCKDGWLKLPLPPPLTSEDKKAASLELQPEVDRAALLREAFQTAQWAQISAAAKSLAQMAARTATTDPKLAALVRQRQDLVAEWSGIQDATENSAIERRATIGVRLTAIDATLAEKFPDYAAFVSPKPISAEEVQSNLRDDEALVLFLDTDDRVKPLPEETFAWVVTKRDVLWTQSELGTKGLTERVAALRCGLDAALWDDEPAAARCRKLIEGEPERDAYGDVRYETLPFDTTRANALYEALFGPIADTIRDKHLLIVPSVALSQLPFQVLITDKEDPALGGIEALRHAAWLARSHALTVLPSVSSLKALRQFAKESHASKPYLGFGNPLLEGDPTNVNDAKLAKLAREWQTCPDTHRRLAALSGTRGGALRVATLGGRADLEHLKMQVPLPETAVELCDVAEDLKAEVGDVRLGDQATEGEVKQLSKNGDLAQYRIVHFATHGVLAGEIRSAGEWKLASKTTPIGKDDRFLNEPGLILNPPNMPTETDDGYLSASEIAALKLDADWVILSACNTAAGGSEGAEALSGLARAFFYAGARALLVSHWSVDSDATVKLITGAMSRMESDKRIGRAEAMRQSMVAIIDKGKLVEAHPAFWAPFVVVGEGAVR